MESVQDTGGVVDEVKLREELKQYHWYHTIQLTPNVATPGWPVIIPLVEMGLRALRSVDLRGKRVLDIGCRDGLFGLEAERLGAREVIGFDNTLAPGIPEFITRFFRSGISFRSLNLYDLAPSTFGLFDVVIFPGVLYHLRYPFWALKLVREVLADGGTMVLETAVLIDGNRHAMMFCPTGSDSPYEPTSCTFFNLKGLTDTLVSIGFAIDRTELASRARHLWWWPLPAKPVITRCAAVCRKAAIPGDARTYTYWEGAVGNNAVPNWDQMPRT